MRQSGKLLLVFFLLTMFFILGGVLLLTILPSQQVTITSPLPTAEVQPNTVSPTRVVTKGEDVAVTKSVEQFYTSYETCLKNPPAEAVGKGSRYCQEQNPYTTTAFIKNLAEGGVARRGADPITCAQNPPSSTSVESVDFESPNRAVATVLAVFGSSLANKIPVVVIKVGEQWEVDAVTCPTP
jgi:hypothetical protein